MRRRQKTCVIAVSTTLLRSFFLFFVAANLHSSAFRQGAQVQNQIQPAQQQVVLKVSQVAGTSEQMPVFEQQGMDRNASKVVLPAVGKRPQARGWGIRGTLCRNVYDACQSDRECGLALVCAEPCSNVQCETECKDEAVIQRSKTALEAYFSCFNSTLLQSSATAAGAAMQFSQFQSQQLKSDSKITKPEDSQPKQACPDNGQEKAEVIAITRATDKILAVCRNARICVGGLRQVWRFNYFDVRPGYGPCTTWAGGSTTACSLTVKVATKKSGDGWAINVQTTFGAEKWAFPVAGLLNVGHNFKEYSVINLAELSADMLARKANLAEQQVLVVSKGFNDVLSYNISCPEVVQAYPANILPHMPPYVSRPVVAAQKSPLKVGTSIGKDDVPNSFEVASKRNDGIGITNPKPKDSLGKQLGAIVAAGHDGESVQEHGGDTENHETVTCAISNGTHANPSSCKCGSTVCQDKEVCTKDTSLCSKPLLSAAEAMVHLKDFLGNKKNLTMDMLSSSLNRAVIETVNFGDQLDMPG